jgi:hypothetical protein
VLLVCSYDHALSLRPSENPGVGPLVYLRPFLDVVRSQEASGVFLLMASQKYNASCVSEPCVAVASRLPSCVRNLSRLPLYSYSWISQRLRLVVLSVLSVVSVPHL